MSHYLLLVIGGNVEEQLAPFHEFECTGIDEYVQDIDKTEEARQAFAEHTETHYKDPEGNLHDPFTPEGNWDLKFWRELTPEEQAKFGSNKYYQDSDAKEHGIRLYSCDWHDGIAYHTKAFQWPSEGWSEVEVPSPDVESFAKFVESYYGSKIVPFGEQPDLTDTHKYGYILLDAKGDVLKVIDRTNPGKKWDWYTIGGRWQGYFKLKDGKTGELGEPGVTFGTPTRKIDVNRADQCLKGSIDIEGMRDEAGKRAAERYDKFTSLTAGLPRHTSWEQMREMYKRDDGKGGMETDWEMARDAYHAQPAVKALRECRDDHDFVFDTDDCLCTREEYMAHARAKAIATFAVLKDGQWYSRGEMGWWGAVHDEKDNDKWLNEFSNLIDALPDDTLLTAVDCHI